MATLSAQRTDAAGTPISYASADVLGDQTAYNKEVLLHIRNTNSGVNEVQSLSITGSPTGGTFTLTFTDPYTGQSATTSALARNADAPTIQAALEALTLISPGNVTVTGTTPGPFTITFVNNRGGQSLPNLITAHTFTGGSSPNAVITQTTDGTGQITVVVKSPTPCDQGFFHDQIVVVGSNNFRHIGPFKTRFNQSDNTIKWTYSSVTNIKVAVLLVEG